VESDVAPGVARALKDFHLAPGPAECVAARDGGIDARNLFSLVFRPNDLAAKKFFQPQISGDRVFVVVRRLDMRELPAKFPEFGLHSLGVGRVN
jgi:hypothetical protein